MEATGFEPDEKILAAERLWVFWRVTIYFRPDTALLRLKKETPKEEFILSSSIKASDWMFKNLCDSVSI